jgi:hypothetical protein
VDLECANYGFGVKKWPNCFLHFRVLRAVILLRILSRVPEAKCHDTVIVFVRDQNHLIDKAFLFLQDRQDFVIDGGGELFILSWLGG